MEIILGAISSIVVASVMTMFDTDRRENIQASIELLSTLRDKMIVTNEETYDTRLLMWLIEQLQQSLLILDAIE